MTPKFFFKLIFLHFCLFPLVNQLLTTKTTTINHFDLLLNYTICIYLFQALATILMVHLYHVKNRTWIYRKSVSARRTVVSTSSGPSHSSILLYVLLRSVGKVVLKK
jgi:hypothetical protein